MPRERREPQRTCIGCREVAGKRGFVRIVRDAGGGVAVEEAGERLPGRGAYLHRRRSCWERALRGGRIAAALRVPRASADVAGLRRRMETMPANGAEEA